MEFRIARPITGVKAWNALFLGALLGTGLGCIGTGPFVVHTDPEGGMPACQMVATWYPEVVTTPDPAHGGAPVHGLAGRVYLFGPEIGAPVAGNGALIVDLFDDSPAAQAKKSGTVLPLEEWRLDRDTLNRLKKPDAVGWGYTLFLPWATYRPELSHVHLRLRYEPATGTPLFNESATIVLRRGETDSWQSTDIPALHSQPATQAEPRTPTAPAGNDADLQTLPALDTTGVGPSGGNSAPRMLQQTSPGTSRNLGR
jgi:hypothetical protein